MQKITPCLTFDGSAKAAVDLYLEAFEDTSLTGTAQQNGADLTVMFKIAGWELLALNAGASFKPTPAVSFIVDCESEEQIEALFNRLSPGGQVMMQLGHYEVVEAKTGGKKFAWLVDPYGVSWQLNLTGKRQKITPCLMFVQDKCGRALEAIHFYSSLFAAFCSDDAALPDKSGAFQLAGLDFFAFDSPEGHQFSFTPGISFMLNCRDQAEIDGWWQALTEEGGEEIACGWLRDKFGVSWQIVPESLCHFMLEATPDQIDKGMAEVVKMVKLDKAVLDAAYS